MLRLFRRIYFKLGDSMVTGFLKLFFVVTAVAASTYSMNMLGLGLWSWLFLVLAFLVLLSVFVAWLDPLSIIIGIVSGILSGIALVLLLLAATVGGSFSMSESNVVFSFWLALLSFFGLMAFFWKNRGVAKQRNRDM